MSERGCGLVTTSWKWKTIFPTLFSLWGRRGTCYNWEGVKRERQEGHNYWFQLDHKESQVQKNWCFWTVVLEKTLASPLESMEIKPVNPKENQSWLFIRKTDAEAETPILWSPDMKSWLTGKVLDAGKDWRQEEKGTTEDKMLEWHHQLDGHEFEQALGVDYRQRSLASYSPWGCKVSDTTEQLNW